MRVTGRGAAPDRICRARRPLGPGRAAAGDGRRLARLIKQRRPGGGSARYTGARSHRLSVRQYDVCGTPGGSHWPRSPPAETRPSVKTTQTTIIGSCPRNCSRQETPEVSGILQHDDSHSFTRDNRSSMACVVNFARAVARGTAARLVASTASLSCIESRYSTKTKSGPAGEGRGRETSRNLRPKSGWAGSMTSTSSVAGGLSKGVFSEVVVR